MKIHNRFFTPPHLIFTLLLALSAVIAGCKIDSDSTTEYTLTFNSNGGSGEMKAQTAEEGTEITIAQNAFTYDGYDFTGWNTASDGSGTSYEAGAKLTLTADITLYAQWEKIIFCTIKFDANGGEGKVPDDITIASGKQTTLPAVELTKDGYIFAGWNTATDGSGANYEDKASITPNSSITLYAKWAISAASVSSTIKSLSADGVVHTVALAGLITKDVITMIRDTLAENPDIKVNLDLSATTGLTEIPDNAFYFYSYNESDGSETAIICANLVGIVLPKNITSIGYYAFGFTGISEIIIPDSVTKIGEGAFSDTKLTQITIPESVTEIGGYAFRYTDISEVVIPSGVTKIENGVFMETKLKEITIPNTVKEIGDYAFSLSSLTTVKLGSGVERIGEDAFCRCDSLTKVTVPGNVKTIGNGAFSSCKNLEEVVFEEGVQTIGDMAFNSCKKLATVTIPKSITSIEKDAFYNCSGITRVNYNGTKKEWAALLSSGKIDGSNNELTNGPVYCTDGVLYSAAAIPDAIKSVSADGNMHTLEFAGPFPSLGVTFENIKAALEENSGAKICFDMSLTTGMDMNLMQSYGNSSSLVGFVLPEDCTIICDYAFGDWAYLESVVIGNKVTAIGSAAFYGCSSLKSIVIPDTVTEIGSYAFYCSGLESVVIGKGVVTIGEMAFSECASLAKVTVPGNVKTIGNMAFYYCNNLEEIVLEEGVEYINKDSFNSCEKLKTVTIPKSVQQIGESAFNYCTGITSVTYGGTKAEWKAFIADTERFGSNNECLTNVSIKCSDGTITNIPDIIKNLPEGTHTVTVTDEITEEDLKNIAYAIIYKTEANVVLDMSSATGLTRIPDSMFRSADKLVEIMLPQGITSIGEGAFMQSVLSEIVLPDSLTEICDGAFYECTSLTSVIIPNGVTTIGKEAFKKCSSLKTMTIPASVTSIGNNAVTGDNDNVIEGFEVTYKGTIAQWKTVREKFTNLGTKSTLSNAIVRCTDGIFCTVDNAPSVISALPEGTHTLTVTDDTLVDSDYTATGEAIRNNPNVKIKLDMDWSRRYPSNDATFKDCTNLISIILSDKSIGESEFAGCTGLTSVYISENVTYIDKNAFSGCTELASVSIPASVTDIGQSAFENCAKLTSISIPEKVTSIDPMIFKDCTVLESVSIPEGIKNIYKEAFANCTSLKEITIPAHLELFVTSAFDGCTSLKTVTYGRDGLVLDCGGDTEPYIVSSKIAYLIKSLGNDGCTVKFRGTADGTTVKCIGAGLKNNTTGAKFNIDITGLAGLTDIPTLALRNCTALESIALPATITSIGDSAFDGCTNLTTVYYAGTKAEWEAVTIGEENASLSSATIRCSDGDITPSGN